MDIPHSLPTARPAPLPNPAVIAAWIWSAAAVLTVALVLLIAAA